MCAAYLCTFAVTFCSWSARRRYRALSESQSSVRSTLSRTSSDGGEPNCHAQIIQQISLRWLPSLPRRELQCTRYSFTLNSSCSPTFKKRNPLRFAWGSSLRIHSDSLQAQKLPSLRWVRENCSRESPFASRSHKLDALGPRLPLPGLSEGSREVKFLGRRDVAGL